MFTLDDYRSSHLCKGVTYDDDLAADPFDAFLATREAIVVDDILQRVFPSGIPRYLDFACGTGRVLGRVAPRARECYGIDVSASMLEQAKRKCPSARLIETDITASVPDVGTFDLITAFRFFGNAEDGLRRSALTAIRRLLAPDGYFVLNSHRNPRSLRNLIHGNNERCDLDLGKLRRLLREGGFTIESVTGIGWWAALDRCYRREVLESAWATRLEALPVGKTTTVAALCPDAVVVARNFVVHRTEHVSSPVKRTIRIGDWPAVEGLERSVKRSI